MAVALVAVALSLGACGSAESPAPASPSSAAAVDQSSRPTPTPNMPALARRYERIAAKANKVACRFNEALATSDLELIQERATQLANAQRVAADAMRKPNFPPELQAMVDEVIANRAALEAALLALAASTGVDAANEALERIRQVSDEGAATSNLVRGELGLPSEPVGDC